MFTHVMVGTNDLSRSKGFYDACFRALGATEGSEHSGMAYYRHRDLNFAVGKPLDGNLATYANGGTIGFFALDRNQVDEWHAAGLANGGTCEGRPGARPNAPGDAYGAYLRDPDGNKICAFCQVG